MNTNPKSSVGQQLHIPTAADLEKFMREHGNELVSAVRRAREFVEAEKARVAVYEKPIFDRYKLMEARDLLEEGKEPAVIDTPEGVWAAEDTPELERYFEELRAAHVANGSPKGYDPRRIAEVKLSAAEGNLVRGVFEHLYRVFPTRSMLLQQGRIVALFVDGKTAKR